MSVQHSASGFAKRLFRRRLSVALAALTFAALSCAAVGARLAPAQGGGEVRTTVNASGFDPAEATRAAGPFRLTVVNQSGREGLTFRLVRDGGEEVRRGQPTTGAADWSEEFDLPAGRYVLSETSNPAWLFYVTLE